MPTEEMFKDYLNSEFRFSFLENLSIDSNRNMKRVFFKNTKYLFHGVEISSKPSDDSLLPNQSKSYKGKLN